MIKILALDFDGVVIDSLPVRDEGFKYAFAAYGESKAEAAKDYHIAHRGVFRKQKFRDIFLNVIGLEPDEKCLAVAESRFREYVEARILDVPILPGTQYLPRLQKHLALYVVTALPAFEVLPLLRRHNLDRVIKKVFGGPVAKQEHLANILIANNCNAEEMLFVGDALNDYEQSKSVKCLFAGVAEENKLSPFPDEVACFSNLAAVIGHYNLNQGE